MEAVDVRDGRIDPFAHSLDATTYLYENAENDGVRWGMIADLQSFFGPEGDAFPYSALGDALPSAAEIRAELERVVLLGIPR